MIKDKLQNIWSEDLEYLILPDEEWIQYFIESPISTQLYYNGEPLKVSFIKNGRKYYQHNLKRGIPCLAYRGIPVFSEKYKDKVLKKFSI